MALLNRNIIAIIQEKGKQAAQDHIIKYISETSATAITSSNINSVNSAVSACHLKYKKLIKSKSRKKGKEDFDEYMESDFPLPIKKALPHKSGTRTGGEFVESEVHKYKSVAEDLTIELSEEKTKSLELEEKLGSFSRSKLAKEQKEKVTKLQKQLGAKEVELKRTRARESYHRSKIQKLESIKEEPIGSISQEEDRKSIIEENKRLKRINSELLESFEWMEEMLNAEESEVVELFDENSNRYTNDCKKCVYGLLNENVSMSKVGSTINTVLKLVGKTPNKVPSKSTVINMNLQRLSLAQKQVGEVFTQEETTCLLTDETSKKGSKFMGYEASDSQGNLWVIGLRDIKSKSAADTLTVFKEILSDIDMACKSDSKSKLILQHIVATMSDRAATEVKFNTLLQEYKENIMPLVVENFNNFSEDEKEAVCKLLNFFCGLHALIHMAETAEKSLLQAENGIFNDNIPKADERFDNKNEPGTVRLVRTASKAFAAGADDKSGCYGNFSVYIKQFLQQHHLHSLPLVPFRGSRFNILFSNAASVYFLNNEMRRFLQQHGADNRLTKAVLKDLEVPEFVAGLKALGLLSYFFTSPLWILIEDKSINILDMNIKYEQLVNFCDDVLGKLPEFMSGQSLPFGEETPVKRDCILNTLLMPSEHDDTVQVYLQIIFPALSLLCKHLFKDHLEGGVHSHLDTESPALRKKLKCVPKSNKYAESVFGLLDYVLRQKPNVSTITSEAYIMFAQNKTLQWLESKTEKQQAVLIKDASRDRLKLQKKFKLRKQHIEEERRAAIALKIQERENAKIKKFQALEGYTSSMIQYGLWQSVEQVDNNIKLFTNKVQKYAALKAQLNFRQHVLKQVAERNLYVQTKLVNQKRVKLTINEMSSNVKKLIASASEGVTTEHSILTGRRVRHKFIEDGVDKWYIGTVISQVPGYSSWYNIKYEDDIAIYTYELQNDLDAGDLEIVV